MKQLLIGYQQNASNTRKVDNITAVVKVLSGRQQVWDAGHTCACRGSFNVKSNVNLVRSALRSWFTARPRLTTLLLALLPLQDLVAQFAKTIGVLYLFDCVLWCV